MSGLSRRTYYDFFSHFYDFVIALHSRDRTATLRDLLLEKTSVVAGGRLLDICTGTGAVAIRAQQDTGPHGTAVGVDFSRGMIRKAREKARRAGLDGVYFVVADVAYLPFRPSSFQAVTCSHAMYELSPETRSQALEEAHRVLRPAGRFLMMEHCEPAQPFVRLLYQIRLATMGSARNRSFARDEVPFLCRFFRDVKRQLSPTGRSKLIWGVKDPQSAKTRYGLK
jgi:demethylmenaquinone methyltransferase/2-methoxy-6-polyprenyl-1,4-benzoquinol methylase